MSKSYERSRGRENMGIIDELREVARNVIGSNGEDGHASRREEQFISKEARVLMLLANNDGRMWQSPISDELDWSDAKTSRTLSGMEANGQLKRFQIGRRNVVCLPENEPESLRE